MINGHSCEKRFITATQIHSVPSLIRWLHECTPSVCIQVVAVPPVPARAAERLYVRFHSLAFYSPRHSERGSGVRLAFGLARGPALTVDAFNRSAALFSKPASQILIFVG